MRQQSVWHASCTMCGNHRLLAALPDATALCFAQKTHRRACRWSVVCHVCTMSGSAADKCHSLKCKGKDKAPELDPAFFFEAISRA
jgi:hypothetical protein